MRNSGVHVSVPPAEIVSAWPDLLRTVDRETPDIGSLPHGTAGWGVGVNGRISIFGEPAFK
jgi:hypothetical protein